MSEILKKKKKYWFNFQINKWNVWYQFYYYIQKTKSLTNENFKIFVDIKNFESLFIQHSSGFIYYILFYFILYFYKFQYIWETICILFINYIIHYLCV